MTTSRRSVRRSRRNFASVIVNSPTPIIHQNGFCKIGAQRCRFEGVNLPALGSNLTPSLMGDTLCSSRIKSLKNGLNLGVQRTLSPGRGQTSGPREVMPIGGSVGLMGVSPLGGPLLTPFVCSSRIGRGASLFAYIPSQGFLAKDSLRAPRLRASIAQGSCK